MISTNAQYLACLSYGVQLQKVIGGNAVGVNPELSMMGVLWASNIYNKLQAVVNAYLSAHPQSGSAGPSAGGHAI